MFIVLEGELGSYFKEMAKTKISHWSKTSLIHNSPNNLMLMDMCQIYFKICL